MPPGIRRAPHREWRAPIRVFKFQIKGVHSLLSDVMYTLSLQVCACLGEACTSLTQQNAFQCIFLLFSVLSSTFLLIDSCLILLFRLLIP